MPRLHCLAVVILLLAGCTNPLQTPEPQGDAPACSTQPQAPAAKHTLSEARKGFQTNLVRRESSGDPVPEPPTELFRLIKYPAAPGQLAAYLSPDPKDGKKHPAIIWITGGDCSSIGDGCWEEGPADNDQSAAAYRKAGLIMMFPSLRGGNDNPGVHESFLGEIDDVLAAGKYLTTIPYVDPNRIYLGGHSTGGTVALLAAECSDQFRAVFSFGPVHDITGYGRDFMPFTFNLKEILLRAPGRWLRSIQTPVFVFEGSEQGNIQDLRLMGNSSTNPKVQFFEIRKATHFSVLGPTNGLIAKKLIEDVGPTCTLSFTGPELLKVQLKQ